jgi:hypothetical protein
MAGMSSAAALRRCQLSMLRCQLSMLRCQLSMLRCQHMCAWVLQRTVCMWPA